MFKIFIFIYVVVIKNSNGSLFIMEKFFLKYYVEKKTYVLFIFKVVICVFLLLLLNNAFMFLIFIISGDFYLDFYNYDKYITHQGVLYTKISETNYIYINEKAWALINENYKVSYAMFVYYTRLNFFCIKIFFDIISSCFILYLFFYIMFGAIFLIHNLCWYDVKLWYAFISFWVIALHLEIVLCFFDFYEFLCIDFSQTPFKCITDSDISSYKNISNVFSILAVVKYLLGVAAYKVKDEDLKKATTQFATYLYILLMVFLFMCFFIKFL